MSVGLVISLVVLAAGLYMSTMRRPQQQQQNMSPNTLEAFKATTNDEGTVVPIVLGKARISANLWHFGELVTEEVTETVETGGKGGGGGEEEVTVGYKYYMDLWYGLCIGPGVEILGYYSNDKFVSIFSGTYNPGDTDYFPTEAGELASPNNPIAHVFFKKYYLGKNVSAVPTLHFVVLKESSAPLVSTNLSNGINPAAAIYDLLVMSGEDSSNFVLSTFNDAAAYWESKGYGINIVINEQVEVRNIINRIFTYVDGNIREDSEGRHELIAWKDTDTYSYEIDEFEMKEFNFRRKSWDDVNNDFRGNFTDSDQDWTERTVRCRNSAVRSITGESKQIAIDLTAFIDSDTASKRIHEIMKKSSYPEAEISCKVSLKYSGVGIGDVVRISHSDYGIANADFRLIGVDLPKDDSNEITWSLQQLTSTLFDATFTSAAGANWVTPTYSPVVPYDAEVFELPYNNITGRDPAYLILVARKGVETGFNSLVSLNGGDYLTKGTFSTFSQKGILDEIYPNSTNTIDDEIGIIYTPEREDPSFETISRNELFTNLRVALVGGTELVAFQNVEPYGVGQIKLTGCIRGILNTPISTHTVGKEIWLTTFANNVLLGVNNSVFNLKNQLFFGSETLDLSLVVPITVVYQGKALKPWGVNSAAATRSGSDISVVIENTTQEIIGAGIKPIDTQFISFPNPVEGFIEYWTNVDSTKKQSTSVQISYIQSGSHTLYLRQVLNGYYSDTVNFVISAADGEYYLEDNQLSPSNLEKIRWGTQGWQNVINRNAQRLNDNLLYLSALQDVNDAGISNGQAIVWDTGTSKFIPADWGVAFPPTTTTTSTTTTTTV